MTNYFFKLASFKIAGTSYTHYFQWCSTCLCGTLYTKSGISQILCSLQHWEGAKIVPGESLQKHSNKRLICICSNFCISMTIMMKECLMALMRGQVFYLEMDRFLCSWLRDVAICAVNDQEEIGWQDGVIKGYTDSWMLTNQQQPWFSLNPHHYQGYPGLLESY